MYKHYYSNQAQQKGRGAFFAGRRFQKGAGIGSIFGSLFRRALPFLSNITKQIGKQALKTSANVLADTASGHRIQDSIKTRLRESGQEMKREAINKLQNAITSQTGSGRKRKMSRQSKEGSSRKRRKLSPKTQKRQQKKQRRTNSKRIKRKKTKRSNRSRKTTKPRTYQDIFG